MIILTPEELWLSLFMGLVVYLKEIKLKPSSVARAREAAVKEWSDCSIRLNSPGFSSGLHPSLYDNHDIQSMLWPDTSK